MKKNNLKLFATLLLGFISFGVIGQTPTYTGGFNYFGVSWVNTPNTDGAGYFFYSAVVPPLSGNRRPGPWDMPFGNAHTWMEPLRNQGEPSFYHDIEGGYGYGWMQFIKDGAKFSLMGGVAKDFASWANGPGTGAAAHLPNGEVDWDNSEGFYGAAQLSNRIIWPRDGVCMKNGSNGEFLGFGYHPLPITDEMSTTYGHNFKTGNQCWTLFLNSANFKGPVTFFLPTYWTRWVLTEPQYEGLFLDTRNTDKNQAFAVEGGGNPAFYGVFNTDTFARIPPMGFPANSSTNSNYTELLREVMIPTKKSKWNEVDNWFKGGPIATTKFDTATLEKRPTGNVGYELYGEIINHPIDYNPFIKLQANPDYKGFGLGFYNGVVKKVNGSFITPEYYKLNQSTKKWEPIDILAVPASTGLTTVNTPTVTTSDLKPLVTPMELDCSWQDPNGPWKKPGPVAGPFYAYPGDGTKVKYYWYKFIEQPSIVHANLPASMLVKMQERAEKIHTHWKPTDNYFPNPTSGTLISIDPEMLVTPPNGLEVGYVPIVTRIELDTTTTTNVSDPENNNNIVVFPSFSNGLITISSDNLLTGDVEIFDVTGKRVEEFKINGFTHQIMLSLPNGMYCLRIRTENTITTKKIFIN